MVNDEYRLTLKEMPEDTRPRERLLQSGAAALNTGELLAILLRTGNKKETAIDMANKILHHCDGLKSLANISVEELSSFEGIGPAKSAQIKAAIELGHRIYKEASTAKSKIAKPSDVVDLVMEMQFLEKEHFKVISLSTKNRVIGIDEVFVGSLNSSIVHPREIFKKALEKSAASVILVHNHPSGDPEPSKEDIQATVRLVKAGEIMGIEVLDHIIIGANKHSSLKELSVI